MDLSQTFGGCFGALTAMLLALSAEVSGNLCARRNMTERNRYAKQKDHQSGRDSGVA